MGTDNMHRRDAEDAKEISVSGGAGKGNPPRSSRLCGENNTVRTGLAGRMRKAMKAWDGEFAIREIGAALGITDPHERDRLSAARRDFLQRGEIERVAVGRYRYNHAWRPAPTREGVVQAHTLHKAIYVSARFTAGDIQRRTGARQLTSIHRALRRLAAAGYIRAEGRRGHRVVYRVVSRDRFRKELLD